MEADSIGGDSFLYDFLPDIPEMNSDLIDDMYESTIEHPEPKDESDLEINYQENTGIQNILLSNDSPVQYHNLYLEEDVPIIHSGRERQISNSSQSTTSIATNSSRVLNYSPNHQRIKYSPCYSNDSNPLSPAIEEVQMNNSRVEQNQPIQQYQQIPNDQKIQPPRPTPQSKTVTYIIQPIPNVRNVQGLGGQPKKPKKVERNKAHNAIEKRYRHSINDRIDDLRKILGRGKDPKMSKSLVLRHAIEEIVALRKRNEQLQREILKYVPQVPFPEEASSQGSPDSSPDIMEEYEHEEVPLRIGGTNNVRSDTLRMIYCVVGVIALFMPLNSVVGNFFVPDKLNDVPVEEQSFKSRHLEGIVDDYDADAANKIIENWSSVIIFFVLNGASFLYFMYKGLVTMEPITPMDSCEYNQFQKSFSMATHDFNHHNVESSRNRLNYCLSSLGRFRATSTLEGITSVLWSAFLYFSNKSGIKWFVCCLASKLGSDAHTDSSRMSALAYYMLAKVEFAEREKFGTSKASLASYAAQSILLMEQANDKLSATEKCEIYVQGILIARAILPDFISKIICGRLQRRASDIARKTELEGYLSWLSHPMGENFINEPKLQAFQSIYCSSSMSMCPVFTLSRSFRGHLFERIVNALCNRYTHEMDEIRNMLDLLQTCSKSNLRDQYTVIDKVSYWWSMILTINFNENDSLIDASEELKSEMDEIINNIPSELNPEYHTSTNPAQLLAVTNYCAYKALTGDIPVDCMMGTLTIMNETISSSLQNILTEQNKIDRITGLELAAASADLALSLLQKSCDKSTLSEEERLALVETGGTTVGLMRNILSVLPASVNRLEKWESYLSAINRSNPVGIFTSIRLFGNQSVNCDDRSSDSDTEFSKPIELCRQTRQEARQLQRWCLPEPFMSDDHQYDDDRGIT